MSKPAQSMNPGGHPNANPDSDCNPNPNNDGYRRLCTSCPRPNPRLFLSLSLSRHRTLRAFLSWNENVHRAAIEAHRLRLSPQEEDETLTLIRINK